MNLRINPKLEGVFVNNVVVESVSKEVGQAYRVYSANVATGQRPSFLYSDGIGNVALGRGDVYYEKKIHPLRDTLIDWEDEQAVYDFAQTHFQLKQKYAGLKKQMEGGRNTTSFASWVDFANQLDEFSFYRVAPAVSEDELMRIPRADLESSVDLHVSGNYDLDPRIKAWGYGGLARFPQNNRFVPFTKYRGHSLIIKSPKSGCSHIAKRTMPTYDQVSTKSFEGFADADGNVSYSPLHENFHACVLDEIDQLEEGVMSKLFAFMESGDYLSVKATKRISNQGNSRLTFITNPKSMDENRGMVFAVSSVLDAYFDVLYKLTRGNFVAGMSRFGLVVVSANVKEARGKSLPHKEQLTHDAVATSLFDVLTPKVASLYDNEQTQAWLSTPIDYYDENVRSLIQGFDDARLKQAWGSQRVAYRHVKGASLEIAIAENAYSILHDEIDTATIVEDATRILEDVVAWNTDSLREIVNTSKREEGVDALASRLKRAKPAYTAPILTALIQSPTGREVDLEAYYDALPRSIREALDKDNFYCWNHVARSIKRDGAYRRLTHALSTFGVSVARVPPDHFEFHLPQDKKEVIKRGIEQAFGIEFPIKPPITDPNKPPFISDISKIDNANPANPVNPVPTENTQGKFRVSDNLPHSPHSLLTPTYPESFPREGVQEVDRVSVVYLENENSKKGGFSPTLKRVVFKEDGSKEEVDYDD